MARGLFLPLLLSAVCMKAALAFVVSSSGVPCPLLRSEASGIKSSHASAAKLTMSQCSANARTASRACRRDFLSALAQRAVAASAATLFAGIAKDAYAEDDDSWSLLRGGAPAKPSATFRKPPPMPNEEDPWVDGADEDEKTAKKTSTDDDEDDPWAEGEDKNNYKNPNIPQAPEEKSGLVVLRVAEVATFQEKILRAVASGQLDVPIAPNQIQFGIEILLKNSNLDGNMKLMINTEIPEAKRDEGAKYASRALNGLQTILVTAADINRPFNNEDMIEIADLYNFVAVQLDEMYQLLPPDEKAKYYGYFRKVTEYEKKVAEGTYNPDIDGVLELK